MFRCTSKESASSNTVPQVVHKAINFSSLVGQTLLYLCHEILNKLKQDSCIRVCLIKMIYFFIEFLWIYSIFLISIKDRLSNVIRILFSLALKNTQAVQARHITSIEVSSRRISPVLRHELKGFDPLTPLHHLFNILSVQFNLECWKLLSTYLFFIHSESDDGSLYAMSYVGLRCWSLFFVIIPPSREWGLQVYWLNWGCLSTYGWIH